MSLIPKNSRNPQLVFVVSLHHVGRDLTGAMAATAFAEIERYNEDPDSPESGGTSDFEYTFRNCTLSPFTFTNSDTLTTAGKELSSLDGGKLQHSPEGMGRDPGPFLE